MPIRFRRRPESCISPIAGGQYAADIQSIGVLDAQKWKMKREVSLETMRHVLRVRICPTCSHRPIGSESCGPDFLRSCESSCCIYTSLSHLKDLAEQLCPQPGMEQALLYGIRNEMVSAVAQPLARNQLDAHAESVAAAMVKLFQS